MIAFTRYPFDGRVRLEAESLVEWGYEVCFLVPKEQATATTYTLAGVHVKELNVVEYGGKNKLQYLLSYMSFKMCIRDRSNGVRTLPEPVLRRSL